MAKGMIIKYITLIIYAFGTSLHPRVNAREKNTIYYYYLHCWERSIINM